MGPKFNPIQIIQAMKSGQNPQQMVMQILQERMGNTPLGSNLINLAENNKTQEIEDIVRRMVEQNGGDFDKEFKNFKQMLGFK